MTNIENTRQWLGPLVTIATIAWPPFSAWLLLKLVPSAMRRYVEKEIDRRSDAKLERLKAELQGAYSTLKASVDVLTTGSSGLRPNIIEAVSALWHSMVLMREKFGGVITFDMIITLGEAQEAFGQGKHGKMIEFVRKFEREVHNNQLMIEFNANQLDRHRLFCGDRLWLLFYTYRAVIMRSALLISGSFQRRTFQDWRSDKGIKQLLTNVFKEAEVADLQKSAFGGLSSALSQLENAFLQEATRVMSGSKALAESLSDMQAIMLLQNAKVAASGSAK